MSLNQSLPEKAARKLEREWQILCNSYLTVRPKGSMWFYSRKKAREDLPQGWKLHVSATILSACIIFRLIAPCLRRHQALFKAPKSLKELQRLNTGTYYGFSQIGKFVTVYPPSTDDAVALAYELHRLTAKQPSPIISYDEALRLGSCVHYRYGQFYSNLKTNFQNQPVPAIVRPDGKLVPDRREPGAAVPRWLADPFHRYVPPAVRAANTPLETSYRGYEAIVQRGRGGVYRALDLSSVPARTCIIKEGRKHGETNWLGRDGIYRIQREARFLKTVSPIVGGVPRFITTFRANDNFYLVMEHVAGRPLQTVITSRERISINRTLSYCLNMARIVTDIHSAGWAWLDCKPGNFLCCKNQELRAIDFEGSCRLDKLDQPLMETTGYIPPKRDVANPQADDLYALGASFAQLITRKVSPPTPLFSLKLKSSGPKPPKALVELTKNLLQSDPKARPAARTVQRILEQMQRSSSVRTFL